MAASTKDTPDSPGDADATRATHGGDGAGGGDVKAAFRKALERKAAHHHPDEDHRDAHGAPAAANDVTKRTFRRKSG